MNPKELGRLGENIAAKHLKKSKYKIITMNYRCHFGEIDIIAYKNDTYVFVEVKTRKNLSYGRPIEAINQKKKIHLLHTGEYYLQTKHIKDCDFRFDGIEIIMNDSKNPLIHHIVNII
ncbi:YraN family protein [Inediibacterium massiliense]|uniref:YraN family protein n=1 Tax=Inediibacterium massiliense TaxID=1658111 RepID=UPI0006B42D22|nr:YraN family protein [Inediibacterium massiliense]